MGPSCWSRVVRRAVLLFAAALLALSALPADGFAQESKVVRVGWYESAFNTTDELGRRSGYAYDYQQKIAAYTGWTYEYVEGSWTELLQMLVDGRIDLLSDVSYTDERAKHMLFSVLPMGEENYYLYTAPGSDEINPEDYTTLNGKRVGANKGSIQIDCFRTWAEANAVEATIVELSGTEEKNIEALLKGEIDLYLTMDGTIAKGAATPICEVGKSDFFFAVSTSRPELMKELNGAMSRIQNDNQHYHQQLYAKYLHSSNVSSYLTTHELEWLEAHGTIRVGYQDNYLAFCAKDPETGELTGALREYLDVASTCLENAHVDYEPICYPTSADAMEALARGEVDCVFPTNLTDYDGETLDVFVTPALMTTDMSAVIRKVDLATFADKERVTVAVNAGNPNYDMFLLDHYPDWRAIYYESTPDCLKAVADGQADCVLISNYRYNNIAKQCERYGLATWSTGVAMDYCFAVNRDDTTLYSILAKTADTMPQSTVSAALTRAFAADAAASLGSGGGQTLVAVAGFALAAALLALLFLLLRGRQARRARSLQKAPTKEDFALFDEIPLSYSVYHVTHVGHSRHYDAKVVYANRTFIELSGLPAEAIVGRNVRELFPYVEDVWYQNARRAAEDGETIELDYTDPLSRQSFHFKAWQVVCPGYCAITYSKA